GSSASGSGSASQTGQETTVLYIMLGVMVAAAGVIFFARKKTRA
ncbi:MAG: LPXTG cell wall anchor domain-containing protein, partial [Ruminococcus sp.]|nr:LPXTG cell wall anchor domain-containing protein [Ruminococcus sp.]